jgi:hypothetical protein
MNCNPGNLQAQKTAWFQGKNHAVIFSCIQYAEHEPATGRAWCVASLLAMTVFFVTLYRTGRGAARSASEILMIAGGNHTATN